MALTDLFDGVMDFIDNAMPDKEEDAAHKVESTKAARHCARCGFETPLLALHCICGLTRSTCANCMSPGKFVSLTQEHLQECKKANEAANRRALDVHAAEGEKW